MKVLSSILVIFLCFGFTLKTTEKEPTELQWQHWNVGFSKAVKDKKIALIDVYTDWCGWCKVMDRNTYADAGIQKTINEHFVPIKFNPEKPDKYIVGTDTVDGRSLLASLSNNSPSGYPTTFFYVPSKNAMFQQAGYIAPDQFAILLESMIKKAKE